MAMVRMLQLIMWRRLVVVAVTAFPMMMPFLSAVHAQTPTPTARVPLASPRYATGPELENMIRVTQVFPYMERQAIPPYEIQIVPSGFRNRVSAVDAMVARVSAMMDFDFEAWVQSWHPDLQEELLDGRLGLPSDPNRWTGWWANVFANHRFRIVREIQTGTFHIVSYKVEPIGGLASDSIEIPVPFEAINGEYFVTDALSRDGLVTSSPWSSGALEETVVLE